MKWQIEQLDLTKPWPAFTLREGYHGVCVIVRLGATPIGEVFVKPTRRRTVSHRRLRKLIARQRMIPLLKNISRDGLIAGPQALASCDPKAFPTHNMCLTRWQRTRDFVEEQLLRPSGLPQPFASWVERSESQINWRLPPVTVAVCTRDRNDELAACIAQLRKLEYPEFEILVVDNGQDPVPARDIAQREGVSYVRCRAGGLSRARNAAIENAKHKWIAFTDDDCRPEPNWLTELVRPTQDLNCRCACGLVMPAQLDNTAAVTFELYGGLGRGYAPKIYEPTFLTANYTKAAETWRIGAGANMLIHRDFAAAVGGFDVDMGPGPHSVGGCGEDTDFFYRVLGQGFNVHYNPRAVVHHGHRSTAQALRKQIYSYAVGHAAYHTRCFFAYRDHRSLLHLVWHLPWWLVGNFRKGLRGEMKYPSALTLLEMRGTVVGPIEYAAVKMRRIWREFVAKPQAATATRGAVPSNAAPPLPRIPYDAIAAKKSPRAA
jgi:GT2 family glycosyltransferase